jgi:hypothetical protein
MTSKSSDTSSTYNTTNLNYILSEGDFK